MSSDLNRVDLDELAAWLKRASGRLESANVVALRSPADASSPGRRSGRGSDQIPDIQRSPSGSQRPIDDLGTMLEILLKKADSLSRDNAELTAALARAEERCRGFEESEKRLRDLLEQACLMLTGARERIVAAEERAEMALGEFRDLREFMAATLQRPRQSGPRLEVGRSRRHG